MARFGVTYVLQPPGVQQGNKAPGVLRPVSFITPQHQQINGGSSNQVVIRRFPNQNVMQAKRLAGQQQQQQNLQAPKVPEVQQQQQAGGGTGNAGRNTPTVLKSGTNGNNGNKPHGGMSTSENESDEFEEGGGGTRGDKQGEDKDLPRNGATGKQMPLSLKRKRPGREEVDGEEDDEEGRLVIDEEEDDQDGDVIDDCEEDEEGAKSALELNGAGVDSGFLRHVIETQILNRHKTRIEDWDGTKGHMCQSCHETFLSESGLETHRNRRIHHIFFFCRSCKRDLSFFNKCRLLQHLRNHRVTPTVTSLQNCVMIRLLPESDYLHFKYEDCTSSSEDEEVDAGGGGGSPFTNGGNSSSSQLSQNGAGSTPPPKRLKPSRFRRIARSSPTGRDSDSPPPSVFRQIVQPPQLSSPPPITEKATANIISTLNNASPTNGTTTSSNAVAAIKFASGTGSSQGDSGLGEEGSPPKASQVAVIKSTGNTLSLPSLPPVPVVTIKQDPDNDTAPDIDNIPQIRIRSLSQINMSEEEGEPFEGYQGELISEAPSVIEKIISPKPTPILPGPAPAKKVFFCQKCDRYFRSGTDFFKHLEEAEKAGLTSRSLHRCPTDDVPSWSQCQYVFHTKLFHEQSVPFMCPGCGEEKIEYNDLLEHVTNDCFYLAQRVRYMCAANVSTCSFADRHSVKTEPEIIDHLKKEHSRSVLQCLHCTQGFATDNWLLKHLADSHAIHVDESKGPGEREALVAKTTRPLTQCLVCNILFPNGPTYLQHVYLNFHVHINHVKMFECQGCYSVFETREEFQCHRESFDVCQMLDPWAMKITEGLEHGRCPQTPSPPQQAANSPPVVKVSPPKSPAQSSQVAVITTAGSVSNDTSTNSYSGGQKQCQASSSRPPSRLMPACSALPQLTKSMPIRPAGGSRKLVPGKTPFDELLSCQFCERLVVYTSVRKHEDQCCGLSTVDPAFCLTCKQYFGDKSKLARHGIQHLSEGVPICLYCNNRHIRPTHPKTTTATAHENLYALKKHLYSNHTSKIINFPWKCALCSSWLPDKRACEFHIKDHQFKYQHRLKEEPPKPVQISQEQLEKMVNVRKKGLDPKRKMDPNTIATEVYFCPVCKNREFSMEAGLARHLKLVHQKNPKSLNMSLLKKPSSARRYVMKAPELKPMPSSSSSATQNPPSNKPMLRSVISGSGAGNANNKNTAQSPQRRQSPATGSQVVSSSSTANSFTSRFSSSGIVLRKRLAPTTSPLARKPLGNFPPRSVPNTRQRTTSSTTATTTRPTSSNTSSMTSTGRLPSNFLPRSSLSSKSVRQKDGTITCLKCPTFSCKSEKEFCEHVKWKHIWPDSEIEKLKFGNKLEERSEFWCPECDTTFVAKPSLVRHLKFAHEYIKSPEEYLQKIGYDGKKPLKPNQCEVCYFQCQDDRELQQHMRTHGMAFLRLRQQQRQMNMTNKN